MNKEEILKQVNFDLNKAKQIHQWLNEAPEDGAQAAETRKAVSIHYGEDGQPDGILIQTLDEAFILTLHDEGEMDYEKAKAFELPTAKQAHIYGAYLDEINKALDEAGGDRLEEDWYWTKTPSAYTVSNQLVFYGTSGYLGSSSRVSASRVRDSLALNTEKALKP
jgi:hypothetical protein